MYEVCGLVPATAFDGTEAWDDLATSFMNMKNKHDADEAEKARNAQAVRRRLKQERTQRRQEAQRKRATLEQTQRAITVDAVTLTVDERVCLIDRRPVANIMREAREIIALSNFNTGVTRSGRRFGRYNIETRFSFS